MRDDLRDISRSICPLLLDKLKDKNRGVVQASRESLRLMMVNCVSFEDVSESFAAAMGKSSTPKVVSIFSMKSPF